MTEREVSRLGGVAQVAGDVPERLEAGAECARCHTPGAGSLYNGQLLHMTCKLEAKRDDGLIGETPVGKAPRGKVGAARFKRTFGGPRS